jgi:hypothetical protein
MKVSSLLKGGIYEVSFGFNPKMEGYTTLMSDILELSEIPPRSFYIPKMIYILIVKTKSLLDNRRKKAWK